MDTDVILDHLYERRPFSQEAFKLFALAENGNIELFVSVLSFSNIYYILRRLLSSSESVTAIRKLRIIAKVLPVNSETIDVALESGFKDFEDAIQYLTAVRAKLGVLITRNTKDYKKASICVCTPKEYMSMLRDTRSSPENRKEKKSNCATKKNNKQEGL